MDPKSDISQLLSMIQSLKPTPSQLHDTPLAQAQDNTIVTGADESQLTTPSVDIENQISSSSSSNDKSNAADVSQSISIMDVSIRMGSLLSLVASPKTPQVSQ